MLSLNRLFLTIALTAVWAFSAFAQSEGNGAQPKQRLSWDQSKSVYNRRLKPPQPPEKVDWEGLVSAMLKEDPGDIVVTAVGDMIF